MLKELIFREDVNLISAAASYHNADHLKIQLLAYLDRMQESLNQLKIIEAQKHEQHVKSEKYASPKQHEAITVKHLPQELDDISSPADAMLVKASRRANLATKIGGGAVTSGFG